MKTTRMKRKLFTGILTTMFIIPVMAQQSQKWVLDKSSVLIQGTSSVHDWEMKAQDVQAEFIGIQADGELQNLNNATLKIKSSKIISENSTMNKKAHSALQSSKYPEITFTAQSVKNLTQNGSSFQATVVGDLKLAGKTKIVAIPVKGKYSGDRILKLQSNYAISMSDFEIDPPTAMMGALKTGDKVTLDFDLQFKEDSTQTVDK